MLFRKKMDRLCKYCARCTQINEEQVLCTRKGVMPVDGKCIKFRYDPCKRIPSKPKALDFSQYEDKDYSL